MVILVLKSEVTKRTYLWSWVDSLALIRVILHFPFPQKVTASVFQEKTIFFLNNQFSSVKLLKETVS